MEDKMVEILNENPEILQKMNILLSKLSKENTIYESQIDKLNLNNIQQSIFDYLLLERNINVIGNNYDASYVDDSLKVYIRESSQYQLLTFEEERKLIKETKEGNIVAKQKLIESNLRLVIYIAKRYRDKGLPLKDLIQEGNIGLMTAIERFNLEKYNKFSTYAVWWIRQSILKALQNDSKMIKISVHYQWQRKRIIDISNNYEKKYGRKPTIEEKSNETGISIKQIKMIESYFRLEPFSLDEPLYDDESTIGNIIPDKNSGDFVRNYEKKVLIMLMRKFLTDNLKKRDLDIIQKRWGICYDYPMTLTAIAKEYNITRERVRQIENRILKKLRLLVNNQENAKLFEGYIDITKKSNITKKVLYCREKNLKK